MEIEAGDFKSGCLKLLDQVEATGEEILVLKHGRPVARVVPARPDQPWLALRGSGALLGDPTEPVIAESDIDVLR